MQSYAILIDGGFAKRKLGTSKAPATADHFKSLVETLQSVPQLTGQRLHRVYYYDSTPLESSHDKPLGGGRVQFGNSPVAAKSRKLFEQLAEQPYMALRLGELVLEGWEINAARLRGETSTSIEVRADDLRPQITQKGVDMRIGMDIAALTLKRLVQTIVLVSGDSDFVPAMKFARREGAHLYLCPLGHRVKPSMREHSDLLLDIGAHQPEAVGLSPSA
ncbi:MAG: NYN domain-containing protein [Burkholderiales bacterium]|nr:NYN domain-containing protein [Burkholderiales bacterium]